MMATAPVQSPTELPPHVWRACGGPSARAPHVGSLVYYFPEGHLEQRASASQPSDHLLPLNLSRPFFLCSVTSVHLLADPFSDEVFSVISLDPISSPSPLTPFHIGGCHSATSPPLTHTASSFAKVLTQSDANNGGGFSVPRFCADSIFPPLDSGRDPPVQALTMRDVHGKVYEFRHIYRGTPRRHLLTTGWSRFVNDKKLVAGDTVVFVKNGNDLLVGIRRGPHYVRSQMAAQEVWDAVEAAAAGRSFQVTYSPRSGDVTGLFVVEKETVEHAVMTGYWSVGARVKLAIEATDSIRTAMYQGSISKVLSKPFPWLGSPWHAIQVTWDNPEVLQLVRYLSPWNIKNTSLMAVQHATDTPYMNPLKRARTSSCSIYDPSAAACEMTSSDLPFHLTQATYMTPSQMQFPNTPYNICQRSSERFKPEIMVAFTPNYYTIFPAGMQGARHHHPQHPLVCTWGLSPPLTPDQVLPDNPLEGSSETGTEQSRSSAKNVASGTIMLFGKLIKFGQESEEGFQKSGDEFVVPGFMQQELKAGIGTHTCLYNDLVL